MMQTTLTGQRRQRRQSAHESAPGTKRLRKSKPRRCARDPVRAATRRGQRILKEVKQLLELRADRKLDVINRLILSLNKQERAELRELGAMQQERYLGIRDAVKFMEERCFNALNSIDLRACEALPIRTMMKIRERLACDAEGKRVVLARPPPYTGAGNPVTQVSNRENGIKWEHKAICVPFVFRDPAQIRAALDKVLEGRTLHLAADFDAAAWELLEMARTLLNQLARDNNLLKLPPGELRVLQLIFDGHGWSSRCGAVRFTLRCVHTVEDHNATRNANDPIFALGQDKCDEYRVVYIYIYI